MKVSIYYTLDKQTLYGDGPWQQEPDKVQWQDRATGLPCLAVRNQLMGNWCGYVGIPRGHPYYQLDYQNPAVNHLEAHGGITFADACVVEPNEATDICHVPGPGESDRVWWFGFDCGHFFDLAPFIAAKFPSFYLDSPFDQTYRTLRYVRAECRALARQLAQKVIP